MKTDRTLAIPLLVLAATAATAAVHVLIEEIGPDVVATAIGTLPSLPALPPGVAPTYCGGGPTVLPKGAIAPAAGALCLGQGPGFGYSIIGPSSFGTGNPRPADDSSGSLFGFNSSLGLLATASPQVNATAIWRGVSLAGIGLTPGPIGTWQVAGGDTITARAAVPGPLGLIGVITGWLWARQLRRRIREAQR